MQLWVFSEAAAIGNRTGFLDVHPRAAALGLISSGKAERAREGGHSLQPVDPAAADQGKWKGLGAFVQADVNLPANTVPPHVSGLAKVGEVLSCTTGTWIGTGITYTYRWLQNNTPIIGATSSDYTVRIGDLNNEISCLVGASNASGDAAEQSNILYITSAVYNYKNQHAAPAAGVINTSVGTQVRVNAIDVDGRNNSNGLRALKIGDILIVDAQQGVLVDLPIEASGYFILEVDVWPLLPDGQYYASLKIV